MPIQPNGTQLEQLKHALLDAFDHNGLTQLVRYQLDIDLEWITPVTGKRDLTAIASDLVFYYASLEGGLQQLLDAALAANPSNGMLNALAAEWTDLDFGAIDLPEDHPFLQPIINRRRFRITLLILIGVFVSASLTLWSTTGAPMFIPPPTPTSTPTVTSTPTPTATPTPGPLDGDLFNVAVADFVISGDSRDEPRIVEFSRDEANNIVELLRKSFEDDDLFTAGDVEFRHVSLDERDVERRHELAAELAADLRADVVLYGRLDTNNPARFTPEFYVSPSLLGAAEATGPNAFGEAIKVRFPLATDAGNRAAFRTQAEPLYSSLVKFMVGLALVKADQFDDALTHFEDVYESEIWDEETGKAILSLWIGTAYHGRALQGTDAGTSDCIVGDTTGTDWDCMLAAYELALVQDPSFARAYIGIANYYLDVHHATHSCMIWPYAVNSLLKARCVAAAAPPEQQEYAVEAYVAWKINYSLGLVYASLANYLCPDLLDMSCCEKLEPVCCDAPEGSCLDTRNAELAMKYLTLVLDAYKSADPGYRATSMARDIASRAGYQLGLVYRDQGANQSALDALGNTIEIATPRGIFEEDWQSIRWIARNQMGQIFETLAVEGDASAWAEAVGHYQAVIDEYNNENFGRSYPDEVKVVAGAYLGLSRVMLDEPTAAREQVIDAVGYLQESIDLVLGMEDLIALSLHDMPLANYETMQTALDRLMVDDELSWTEAASSYDVLDARIAAGESWHSEELRAIAADAASLVRHALDEIE